MRIKPKCRKNSIFLTFDATDQTGFSYANFNFKRIKEDGSFDWDNNEEIWMDDWNSLTIGGSENDGSYVGLLQLSSNSQEGKYELESFYISDEADNDKYFSINTSTVNNVITKSWEKEAKEALGGYDPSKLSFTVIGEGQIKSDSSIPQLTDLSLSRNVINRDEDEDHLLLSFKATDQTGFSYANFNFKRIKEDGSFDWDNNEEIWMDDWNSLTIGGSENDGSYVGLLQLSSNSQEGKYELESFYISDEADNDKYFSINTSTVNNVITNLGKKLKKHWVDMIRPNFHSQLLVRPN